MIGDIIPKETLDCIGLYCPEPLFQTRQKLDELQTGDILEVLADDPAAEEDLSRFCKRTGNFLMKIEKEGNEIRLFIMKS